MNDQRSSRRLSGWLLLCILAGTFAVPSALTSSQASAAAGTAFLHSGETLFSGQQIQSSPGYHFVMQGDGNAVIYKPLSGGGRTAIWASNTAGRSGSYLTMQADGNAVIYMPLSGGGRTAIWASNTAGRSGSYLTMQTDGNLVIYQPVTGGRTAVWASNTAQPSTTGSAMVSPVAATSRVSSNVGDPRPNGRLHLGVDFAAPAGTRTVAVCKMTVTHVFSEGSNGYTVGGWVATTQAGYRYWVAYRHLNKPAVVVGQVLSKGATVGHLYSLSGPHLHFEFKDPTAQTIDGGTGMGTAGLPIANQTELNAEFPKGMTVNAGHVWGQGRFNPAPVC
jgi:murein DD-endopeptidase MepM/ murein hydrolase activator NlpD